MSRDAGVPFVDLARVHAPLKAEFMRVLERALDTSGFSMGKPVQEFEEAFARYCGARHCVGVASGTDALILALRAVLKPGDEVITVPNSFVATAAAVRLAGGTPVFTDVDEKTQLMDPSRIERAISPRTGAILPVHLFGQPADVDAIREIARRHGLVVIEDAAQAHGARLRGRRVGSLGSLAACFSFYPGKNLGALGEGGAITTDDADFAARMRRLREHGQAERYVHVEVGVNARLHTIQAGFLSVKLPHLDEWNAARRRAAKEYARRLGGVEGVVPPFESPFAEHVWHLYVVRVPDRDGARKFLQERGVATGIHYPVPIHRQKAFADLALGPGSFPVTERLAGEILSLPMFTGITDAEIERVCATMKEWVSRKS